MRCNFFVFFLSFNLRTTSHVFRPISFFIRHFSNSHLKQFYRILTKRTVASYGYNCRGITFLCRNIQTQKNSFCVFISIGGTHFARCIVHAFFATHCSHLFQKFYFHCRSILTNCRRCVLNWIIFFATTLPPILHRRRKRQYYRRRLHFFRCGSQVLAK